MKRISKEEKVMWLDNWEKSGKKAWAYAKENGLVPQTFINWTKTKLKEVNQPLIEIPGKTFQSTHLIQEILVEKGDIKIHIPLEPVLSELPKIISKLGQAV